MPPETAPLVLSAPDVTSLFDVDTAVESRRVAFRGLGHGEALTRIGAIR